MAIVHLERPLTYDDLLHTPDDRNRHEIINGELLASPSPNRTYQRLSARLFKLVSAHADKLALGEILFAPIDVRLGAHDVVEPNLLFIRDDRRAIYTRRGVVEGPPDLVVEIISPSSASIDVIRKAALYARAGVPEYWLADPENKTFRLLVLQDDGTYRDARPTEGQLHSKMLAGLVIDPATLFADLD